MTVDDLEFREFYAAQYTRLCWLGLLLTGDQAEAEELAQEALVRTWWRWALHRPDDPAAYARKVLVNRHRSLLRRGRGGVAVPGQDQDRAGPAPGDEQAMVLWQAVRGPPARRRAVLVLRFHEDLTEAEVARLLGLPLGTVKSLAHRGLARLRDRLGSPDLDPTTSTLREAR